MRASFLRPHTENQLGLMFSKGVRFFIWIFLFGLACEYTGIFSNYTVRVANGDKMPVVVDSLDYVPVSSPYHFVVFDEEEIQYSILADNFLVDFSVLENLPAVLLVTTSYISTVTPGFWYVSIGDLARWTGRIAWVCSVLVVALILIFIALPIHLGREIKERKK